MMNLVSRWRVRDPNVLASPASESPVKTKSESQNVPLSSVHVQQTSTVRPGLDASSSKYSELNIDDKWFSQVWISGEMSNTSTGRPVHDKFVIDDDMDSDTVAESNPSLRSRSFLNRVNDRFRKLLDRSPEDSMQDIDKIFYDLARHESQSPLSMQNEKYDRTEKPVVCRDMCHERHRPVENTHSSSYSEWNIDKT